MVTSSVCLADMPWRKGENELLSICSRPLLREIMSVGVERVLLACATFCRCCGRQEGA